MQPLDDYETEQGPLTSEAPVFAEDTSLATLIDASIESDTPLAIINAEGKRAGVVTRTALLRIVAEGTESD